MQLEELRLITASNIIKLRTEAGMTQAELGQRLNYSDKSISRRYLMRLSSLRWPSSSA